MKYYRFSESSELKVIGSDYPQIREYRDSYDADAPDSIYNFASNGVSEITPNLDCFVLSKGAKVTDILSCVYVSNGFIISDKLKDVFEKLTLPAHKMWPIHLYHKKKKILNYNWFYYLFNVEKFVDFDNSIFYKYNIPHEKSGYIKISNYWEYQVLAAKLRYRPPYDIRKKSQFIGIEKLVFNKEFDQSLDLFELLPFSATTFISERFKILLEESNLTGFTIRENTIEFVFT